MENSVRRPAVSGKFYPSDAKELTRIINKFHDQLEVDNWANYTNIIGGIVPHAGYIYSARHAIPFFRILKGKSQAIDTVVILCPNHYGHGPAIALDSHLYWETPLGTVEVDQDFYPLLKIDIAPEAHQVEHSAEVMIPLLQYYLDASFKILPICMRDQTPAAARTLASKLVKAQQKTGKRIMVIASSDFSHYTSVETGRLLDDKVLEKINTFDIEGLFSAICINDISVCGYGPIMTLLHLATLSLDHPEVILLSRGHSGEVFPSSEVVHYISALVGEKVL